MSNLAQRLLDTSVKVYYNPDESITTVEGSVSKELKFGKVALLV